MYVSYVLVPVLIMLQSLSALILRVLASFVNSNTIHKLLSEKTRTVYLLDGNSKDGDHSWTYLFNGKRDRGYHMAKRFHPPMTIFALPLAHSQWKSLVHGPTSPMAPSMRAFTS